MQTLNRIGLFTLPLLVCVMFAMEGGCVMAQAGATVQQPGMGFVGLELPRLLPMVRRPIWAASVDRASGNRASRVLVGFLLEIVLAAVRLRVRLSRPRSFA